MQFITKRNNSSGILLMMAFLILVFLCISSGYSIMMTPDNPGSYSMAAFFGIGLVLLLLFEENNFPDIPNKQMPGAIVIWVSCWLMVSFLASFLLTMEIAHLVPAVFFGVVIFISSTVTWRSVKKQPTKPSKKRIKQGY